jgi:hypothetical protein
MTSFDHLSYSAGNEHSPEDPFGRTVLALDPDGAAQLDHYQRSGHRAWRGRVAPDAVERLRAALDASGYPAVPRHPIPAGSAMRTLVVESGAEQQRAYVAWHAAPKLPGYDELFMVLDSLVRQLSGDTVHAAPDVLPPSVSHVESV